MPLRPTLRKALEPVCRRSPAIRATLRSVDNAVEVARQSITARYPELVRPAPQRIYVTLTAACNLRCRGCLYGIREFMPGQQLPWPIVRDLLTDAAAIGIPHIRLYGGEPMLHKDLPRIVRHATELGRHVWITTNGVLLKKKFDSLYEAGLREFSFGFYGIDAEYDRYVRQRNSYRRISEGISFVREKYGSSVKIRMDWLLMKPTCNLDTLRATWDFAVRYATPIYVNLVHYSLPYFTQGESKLQFEPSDREAIHAIVAELLRLKEQRPEMLVNTWRGLRSIPDWLLLGSGMRVPCTEHSLLWIGADGSVQMCYVTFKLGNLHHTRLTEMLYTPAHEQAARDCVALNCPNCHCSYDRRINLNWSTRRRYA